MSSTVEELKKELRRVLDQLHLEHRNAERSTVRAILGMIGSGDYSTGTWLALGIAERFGIPKEETDEWIGEQRRNHFDKDR